MANLWSSYRDELLRPLVFESKGIKHTLTQGRIEGSRRAIKEVDNSDITGVLVVYVDDMLLCADIHVARALALSIASLWKTLDLALVTKDCPIRFLAWR